MVVLVDPISCCPTKPSRTFGQPRLELLDDGVLFPCLVASHPPPPWNLSSSISSRCQRCVLATLVSSSSCLARFLRGGRGRCSSSNGHKWFSSSPSTSWTSSSKSMDSPSREEGLSRRPLLSSLVLNSSLDLQSSSILSRRSWEVV